jgi:hypothetical protein
LTDAISIISSTHHMMVDMRPRWGSAHDQRGKAKEEKGEGGGRRRRRKEKEGTNREKDPIQY